jgi:hypothetical protein
VTAPDPWVGLWAGTHTRNGQSVVRTFSIYRGFAGYSIYFSGTTECAILPAANNQDFTGSCETFFAVQGLTGVRSGTSLIMDILPIQQTTLDGHYEMTRQ